MSHFAHMETNRTLLRRYQLEGTEGAGKIFQRNGNVPFIPSPHTEDSLRTTGYYGD